jgi:hypothetical protein
MRTASLTSLFVTCLLILVVYIIALCSSINTTTFCFLHVCSILTPTLYTHYSQVLVYLFNTTLFWKIPYPFTALSLLYSLSSS